MLSEPFSPPHVASLCLTSWILQIFPSAITWEWLFLLEQSYLLAAEERERGEDWTCVLLLLRSWNDKLL